MADVAAAAGVSPTTVSHALSGKRAVSEATRARILQVVDDLGYRPNAVAQSLRSQKTKTVGFLVVDISNPYYPAVARAVHDGLAAAGYVSLIGITYGEADAEETVLRDMVARKVDGLIMQPMSLSASRIRQIVGPNMPVVLISDDQGQLFADQVETDDARGIAEAVRYLHEKGIDDVGFVSGPDGRTPGATRLTAFRAAADALGVRVLDDWIEHAPFTRDGGFAAGSRLLASGSRPRAIVCANDVLAVGVIDAARLAGLRVPDDVAIVGFDDIETADLISPRLTTVVNPAAMVGLTCAEALLRRFDAGPDEAYRRQSLSTHLVARESA